MRMLVRFGAIALLASGAFAQTVGMVSAGYTPRPSTLTVAPGQIITVSVFGISTRLKTTLTASGMPLPTMLGGISATVESGTLPKFPVPLLSVSQSPCPTASLPCAVVTDIVLQIPFEVPPPVPPGSERPTLLSNLIFAEDGVAEGFVPLNIVFDRIHISNSCDTTFVGVASTCEPVVTHADGTYVTQAQPAHPGEELVIYALGLGSTNPAVKSGEKSPSPAAVTQQNFNVGFEFQANAPSFRFGGNPGQWFDATGFSGLTKPFFSGLTPGFVGLYQVNFQIPPATIGATVPSSCTSDGSIASNLTVNVLGPSSSDGAGICVAF